jgi:predicted ArsR family transcriptional regulator
MTMGITKETRFESFLQHPAGKREQMILDTLGTRQMTARQIAYSLGFADLNAVKPRLTELRERGVVQNCGKAFDSITKRNVALWEATEGASK